MQINKDRVVEHVSCKCYAAASEKCKHVCALIHFINTTTSASKTSFSQTWGGVSDKALGKAMYSGAHRLSDSYKQKIKAKVKIQLPYEFKYSTLSKYKINSTLTSVTKLEEGYLSDILKARHKKEVEEVSRLEELNICIDNLILLTEDNILESHYLVRSDGMEYYSDQVLEWEYYCKNVQVNVKQIGKICVATIAQAYSEAWFKGRKCRISATKAHPIRTRPEKNFPALVEAFAKASTKKGDTAGMKYGRRYEKTALKDYKSKTELLVIELGLLIKPQMSYLCASPDGIVIEDGVPDKVLEIKCPLRCSKVPVYDEEQKKFNVDYLYKDSEGVTRLKTSNEYFTQCQILMYVCGLLKCDLFVWSPVNKGKGSEIITIARDDMFLDFLLPKIEKFYFEHYLQALVKEDTKKQPFNDSTNHIRIIKQEQEQ